MYMYMYSLTDGCVSTGREVSKKSIFQTSFDLPTVFKGIL